jgi:hypothetical protein
MDKTATIFYKKQVAFIMLRFLFLPTYTLCNRGTHLGANHDRGQW